MYYKRKASILAQLGNELKVLSNRAKYIQEVLDDKIDMRRKTKEVIHDILVKRGYEHINGDDEYRYLLKMPMDSVTDENVTKLLTERDSKSAEHGKLTETSVEALWTQDLDELEKEYRKWLDMTTAKDSISSGSASAGGGAAGKKKLVKKQ